MAQCSSAGTPQRGASTSEQVAFRHTVAMTLDHPKFCDLIVDALACLTRQKA